MVDQLESSRECGGPVLVTVCQQTRDKHLAVRGFLKFLRACFLITERAGAELLYGTCEHKAPVWTSDGAETAGMYAHSLVYPERLRNVAQASWKDGRKDTGKEKN